VYCCKTYVRHCKENAPIYMYYVAPETPMMSSVIADCPDLVPSNILDKSTPVLFRNRIIKIPEMTPYVSPYVELFGPTTLPVLKTGSTTPIFQTRLTIQQVKGNTGGKVECAGYRRQRCKERPQQNESNRNLEKSRFIQRPQKRNRGNQLIHRRLSKEAFETL